MLFEVKGSMVRPTGECLLVSEFKAVWDRDRHRNKSSALEELAYVYFMVDYQSPYRAYPPGDRGKQIRNDIIARERWSEDKLVRDAMKKYDELQQTPTLRFLMAAEGALEKITTRLRDVTFSDDKDISAIVKAISDSKKLVADIEDLKERVKKEKNVGDTKIRGGGKVNPYEE
jgi:hypothetical protein